MTGQDDSKFGFGLASGAAAEAVARLGTRRARPLVGIHAHIGSQIFALESFDRPLAASAPFFRPTASKNSASAAASGSRM